VARPSWVNLAEMSSVGRLWSAPTEQGKHATGQEEDLSDLRPWSSNQGQIRVRWAPVSKVRVFQPTGMHTYLKDESVQPTFACSSAQCDRRSRRWAKKHGGAHEDVPSMPAFQPTDSISQLRKLWNDMPPWRKGATSPSPGPSDKSSESADAASLASAATTPQVMGVEEMWQNDGQEELSEDTPSTQARSATACVALMGQMQGRAEAISGQFNSQHVANTLWAYATMGKKPGERILGQLEGRAEATSGELNSQVKTSIAVSFAVPSWQHGFDWRTSGGKGGETERGRDRWREGEREDLILSLLPSKSGI
jgi:hypothetical protein